MKYVLSKSEPLHNFTLASASEHIYFHKFRRKTTPFYILAAPHILSLEAQSTQFHHPGIQFMYIGGTDVVVTWYKDGKKLETSDSGHTNMSTRLLDPDAARSK